MVERARRNKLQILLFVFVVAFLVTLGVLLADRFVYDDDENEPPGSDSGGTKTPAPDSEDSSGGGLKFWQSVIFVQLIFFALVLLLRTGRRNRTRNFFFLLAFLGFMVSSDLQLLSIPNNVMNWVGTALVVLILLIYFLIRTLLPILEKIMYLLGALSFAICANIVYLPNLRAQLDAEPELWFLRYFAFIPVFIIAADIYYTSRVIGSFSLDVSIDGYQIQQIEDETTALQGEIDQYSDEVDNYDEQLRDLEAEISKNKNTASPGQKEKGNALEDKRLRLRALATDLEERLEQLRDKKETLEKIQAKKLYWKRKLSPTQFTPLTDIQVKRLTEKNRLEKEVEVNFS